LVRSHHDPLTSASHISGIAGSYHHTCPILLNLYLAAATLNVNGLNLSLKRHRVAECIFLKFYCMLPTQDSLHLLHSLKVKGGKDTLLMSSE
jgi:hypothetical protein